MPSISSHRVAPSQLRSLVRELNRKHNVDLLLTDSRQSGECCSYIGVDTADELLVPPGMPASTLKAFAFADNRPTVGFLSYDYSDGITKSKNETRFPAGHLKKYRSLVEYDAARESLTIYGDERYVRAIIGAALNSAGNPRTVDANSIRLSGLRQTLSPDQYVEAVRRTLEYIRDGDVYQINLSTKLTGDVDRIPDVDFVLSLFDSYPAAYYAWLHSGPFRILSTSPERFLRVDDGRVLSQPIKGTLQFDRYHASLPAQLTGSPKEDAELSMIVDLIRNDISRNCEYGSVTVSDHKSTFVVDNLLQMYSRVTGTLRRDRTCLDLLLDAFPGGSVTGCPKRRAMEIIDELERHDRDVYCGSFFIIKDRRTMDSSIAIRTGYFDATDSTFSFFAGSGIVVESDPQAEYDETMAKAGKFLTLLG